MKINVTKNINGNQVHEARRLRHEWHAGRELSLAKECVILSKLDAILETNIVNQYRDALRDELQTDEHLVIDMFQDSHPQSNDCRRSNDDAVACAICDDLATMSDEEIAKKHFDLILSDYVNLQSMECREQLNELLRSELDRVYRRLDPNEAAKIRDEKRRYSERVRDAAHARQEREDLEADELGDHKTEELESDL